MPLTGLFVVYSAADAVIVLENNVMLNSGDGDGQLIKAGALTAATVSLEYNYWGGAAVTTAVDGGLTRPSVTGIRGGTFRETIDAAYCAGGVAGLMVNGASVSGCTFTNFCYGVYLDNISDFLFDGNTISGTKYNAVNVGENGGSGVTYYSSTVECTANGTVTVSPRNASKGAAVTVTVTPDEGYELGTLTVTDANGSKLTLTDKGDGKYTFTMPAAKVTIRAAFVEKAPVSTLPFTDVAADAWYADAVNWAAAKGIVNGYGDGTFGPEDAITREQMAVLLYNYARFKGEDMTASADLSGFTDGDQVSDWAEYAMKWAVAEGLMNGSNNALNPLGTASRAEAAQVLMNCFSRGAAE